jgi:hypothetical protein
LPVLLRRKVLLDTLSPEESRFRPAPRLVIRRRNEEAAGLAEERHTTAFVVGLVLGGLAGAAMTFWKTPRSGVQSRTLIAEETEEFLFRLTRMNDAQTDEAPAGEPSAPVATPSGVEGDAMRATAPAAPISPSPDAGAADAPAPVAEDDETPLPTTFRGETLTENPADIVLDGPRPVATDR